MREAIGVVLLGRNALVREGLARILSDDRFDVRQSVDCPSKLSDDCSDGGLVVIVDAGSDTGHARDIHLLHRRFPKVRIVVLRDTFDLDDMVEAFRAGVDGYILKEISCKSLIGSLRLVAMGEKVMPSRLVEALPFVEAGHRPDRSQAASEMAQLSERENEILNCLVMGCPNKVISRRLQISEATVKVHVKAILRKLRVQNRTQAAMYGLNGGLEARAFDGRTEARRISNELEEHRSPLFRVV